jgi:hypothetical protein
MENRQGTLRVVVKDLGSLVRKEDILQQSVNIIVDTPEALGKLFANTKEVEKKIRANTNAMRADPGYEMEYKQVVNQSFNPRDVMYFKFLEVKEKDENDVVIVNGDQPVLKFSLDKVMNMKEIDIKDKGLVLKYQPNFKLLIISTDAFNRREAREGKGDPGRGRNQQAMDEDDDEEDDSKKRLAQRRKNPFLNKLTERDQMGFQLYHQDKPTNILLNIALSSNGNGKNVLDGVIKLGNTYFRTMGDFEKSEPLKQRWRVTLDNFQQVCRGFLPYKDFTQDLLNDGLDPELLNPEGQPAQQGQQQQALGQNQGGANNDQLFSFNEYTIDELAFFEEEFKGIIPYLLPNLDLNHRFFTALNPSFVLTLFTFQSKKQQQANKSGKTQAEMLKILNFYINQMVSKPSILLKYICYCFYTYAHLAMSFGTISLEKSLKFMVKLITDNKSAFESLLANNDQLRELYFKGVALMAFAFNSVSVEVKGEEGDEYYLRTYDLENRKEDFSEYIVRALLLDTLIPTVPALQIEFFNKLFARKDKLMLLKSNFFVFYFNHDVISKPEKLTALKDLFDVEKPCVTKEMTTFIHRIILDSKTIKIPFNEVFGLIDQMYDPYVPSNFMNFMREQNLDPLHQKILLGFSITKDNAALQYVDSNAARYYPSLLIEIRNFLKVLEKDILIEFISVPGLLSDRKIELFESMYSGRPKETSKYVRTLIQGHIKQLTEIKNNVDVFVKVLTENEIYFNEYKFFPYHRDGIRSIQNNILTFTVGELLKNPVYIQSLVLLNVTDWKNYNLSQNYRLFYEKLKKDCGTDISLPDYYKNVLKTMEHFRAIFNRFKDPNQMSLNDYDVYLPRVSFPDIFNIYLTIFNALSITPDTQNVVFEHCKILHSLNKVMKAFQPMQKLSAQSYLKLEKDKFSEGIEYTYNLYNGKDKAKITVADVIKNDKYKFLKVANYETSPTYKMPMMTKDVANSYDCYKFVRDTADEFIKSMREECDNENLDIVNKLDIINKNLKFLMQEKKFEEIVKKFMAIHKDDQRKIKKYLRDLNGQIESHIVHLADKTKKDQNYNQKIIEQMLRQCVVLIKFDRIQRRFIINVQYEERGKVYTIQTVEFEELLNKAKIISESTNAKDAYNDLMRNFRDFGVQLEKLSSNFLALRSIGLIHMTFDLLIPFTNRAANRTAYFQGDDNYKIIKFSHQTAQKDLAAIEMANNELSNLEQSLSKELMQYYSPECYLMTYFYGKKLYFLTQYLRGRASEEEQKQTRALITESIPENLIDFSVRVPIPDNLYRTFNATYENLKYWSANIKSQDKIKLNTSSVFTSKKIKTCTAHVNVYRTICKIVYEANESMVNLSQILFCKKETTKGEIVSFCKRAMLDPFKRLYFILSIDKLEYLMVNEMKDHLLKIIESKYDNLNFNLLIFNNTGNQTKNMFDNENFENINNSLSQLDSLIKDQDFQNTFANLFKTNVIVMSETAGMGKTSWIEKHLNSRFPKYDILLAGEGTKATIKRRLDHLGQCIKGKDRYAIVVKIDFIEDFDFHCEAIDYLLFCICIIKRYYTDIGCCNMRDGLSQIYIEVSNTFITEALSRLSSLELLEGKDQQAGSDFSFRVVMPPFSYDRVWFKTNKESDEQVVGKFLKALKDVTVNFKNTLEQPDITKAEYIALLEQYYMLDILKNNRTAEERKKSTYAQYQFWLQSMARLIREMENSTDFKPAKLEAGSPKDDKNLRSEVAMEIVQFCSYIICVSVGQAKMSQDQMKEIMSELKKKNLQKQNLEEYQKKFNNITPWSSDDLIIPLLFGKAPIFGLTFIEKVFNEEKGPRFRKRMNLRDYVKNTKRMLVFDKETKDYSAQCLELLAKFLGQDPTDVMARAKAFKGKGFVITLDNFMKTCLILLKSYLKIPIVMMGESGCGKTYLSEFVSECLLQDKMKELTLYAGVTELDFIAFMKTAVEEAKALEAEGKNLWVFFDEFNTSSLQSIVAEIMIDRVCSIEPSIYHIPNNMVFISCCNPFRMKTKRAEVGLVPKTSDTILSHRVYPIPERLLNYIWDFGQLSEQDEVAHITSMVAAEKFFLPTEQQKEIKFVRFLYTSHKTVRNIEERSGVSLRDIKRVLSLYRWFKDRLEHLVEKAANTSFKKNEIHLRATICAILVSYGLRLNGRFKEQEDLLAKLTAEAKGVMTLTNLTKDQIKDTLAKLSDVYLTTLLKQTIRIIPENIALNRPLKENFITMLACFDAKIPLIICGAPGTSKTLCSQIFDSAMVSNIIKTNKEFENFKAINSIYYGGSQTSTSEGIAKVFHRAEQYLKQKGEDRPVVVFDEIGLAELSPHNPLKILHPLLEKPNQEIGFFGLSNWTLDLSKMNRLIYLARPDMTKDDLVEIFKISTSGCNNDKAKSDLNIFLGLLADTYLDFRVWQKSNGNHPNFHGSRDIYGVSKFVYTSIMNIKTYDAQTLKTLIKKSIERNFNGAAYLFGTESNELKFDSIPKLDQNKNTVSLNNVRIEDIGTPYGQEKGGSLQVLNIFSSAQIFKQIFINKVTAGKPELSDMFKTEFFQDYPVFDLITANIKDKNARFLLVKSEGEVVDNIFMERLSKLVNPDLLKDWRGIRGKENSHELLSTLKSYINLGFVVVMKNLDELYGSLYDLFNQKYSEVEGRKYCYLYFGESKHRVEVHPDFKAIILLDAESELQGLELELEQPAPFLNRFEKFFVRLANILTTEEIKAVYQVVTQLQKRLQGDMFKILCLSIDMITSIVLKTARTEGGSIQAEMERFLMRLSTSNYLLLDGLTSDQLTLFQQEHPYSSIWELLEDMILKPALRMCLFTFSNPIELEYIRAQINLKADTSMLTSEELINQGLEARAEKMKRYEKPFLVIQFNTIEHLTLITQLKTSISENTKIKKVLFIIHMDRRAKDITRVTKNIGLNFWHDWDNCVIEDINKTNYAEMKDLYDYSLTELLFSERHSMGMDIIKQAALSSLQRIIIEKNDEILKQKFQAIREMMQNDSENTFANILASKIKQSKLAECSEKWRVLVSTMKKEKLTYTDIRSELLSVVLEKFGDVLKKYMMKLNDELANLGSYATYFYSQDLKIRTLYRKYFIEKFNQCQLNRLSIANVKYSQIYYKLPFLSKQYESFVNTYSQKVLEDNKDSFANLAETQSKYLEYSLSKNSNPEVISDLKEILLNGEEYIYNLVVECLHPLIDTVKKHFPVIFEVDELTASFLFDVIFLMIKKWEDKTERKDLQGESGRLDKYKILNILQNKYKFFRQICKSLGAKIKSINDLEDIVVSSSVISICFQSEMKYIFSLIDVSNIDIESFITLTEGLRSNQENSQFRFRYALFSDIVKNMQSKVIPDFKDEKINLKYLKNRYADMISESLRNVAKGTKNYDLKYVVILLDLLEILPVDDSNKYLTEISQVKREQDRLGGNFDISFIKNFITKILKVVHLIPKIDLEKLTLVVSEYINTNAQSLNFNLFIGNDFDNLFKIFDKEHQERIASSLAQDIANNIDPFFSLRELKAVLANIKFSRTLASYDAFLTDIDTTKNRNFYLLVSLIDKLCFIGLPKVLALPYMEFLSIFEFLHTGSNFFKDHTSLGNIIRYAMIRLSLNHDAMEVLKTDKAAIQKMDNLLINFSRSKEMFIDNPNSFPFINFIQTMIVEAGDMSRYQMQYRSITNVCGLVMDEDASGSIIFFSPEIQTYYVDMNNKLSDYAYNNQLDKMSQLIKRDYKGSTQFNLYVVGVVLLNKFLNPISKEDANIIQNIKNLFIKAIESVQMPELYKSLLLAITRGDRFNFKEFLGGATDDPNYEVRLKKVFYQFLLLAICFKEQFGYDLSFYEEWIKGKFDNRTFKAQIVNSDEINNTGSIFENIVIERLSDGSYMDYGERYVANLGIYKCSCDYVYSIGNCGYAMVTRPCPKCGKQIGGANHHFVQRAGHVHVQSLEAFNDLIQDKYKQGLGKYSPHTVMNKSSLEATPIKLKELGVKGLVQALKDKNKNYIMKVFQNKLTLAHLFDHLLVISLPEILPTAESGKFISSLRKLLPYEDKEFKAIYGKMSGRAIENHTQYFLAHVKNDIDTLSEAFDFRNPTMIFDFLRASMSCIAEEFFKGKKMSGFDLCINEEYIRDPYVLLPLQQEIADKIRDNELDLKCVFKAILFRNITPGLITNLFSKSGVAFEHIYQFMRHNSFEREYIKRKFVEALQSTSTNGLLKDIVNYENILKDFPTMLDANVKVAYHFNMNYDRSYNFDEASDLDINTLDDGTLKKIMQEFRRVWEAIIPLHEDKNPEVFSFAYMCQQDLNVKNFIDGALAPGGSKLLKFLFIDPKDYSDKNLLYMSSIVRTFVEKFHNKLVNQVNSVLRLDTTDEKNAARKNIEYCSQEDYVNYIDYTQHVLNNFWYETTINGENKIHFDLNRIEYLCAQDFKKPLINFDEKDIRFYNFKNTKISEYEKNLTELIKKVKQVKMTTEMVEAFENMQEAEVAKSYEFMLEISNYILNNFMFNDENVLLKRIAMNKAENSILQRFSSYDEKLHSKLVLGHLHDMYVILKDLKFQWELAHNRASYSKDLTPQQIQHLTAFIEDLNILASDLEKVKEDIRTIVKDNYHQGDAFLKNPLSYFGFDLTELSPTGEELSDLTAQQYEKINDILNQGIIIKSKMSYVKKRSSIMSDH